jgi:hypothetical protein
MSHNQWGKNNASYKHGLSQSPTYNTWHLMIQRCHNQKAPDYCRYGARGIAVCKRWRKNFMDFVKDMGIRPAGLTLDRIDNLASYSKKNCRWADRKTQHRNTRQNKMITYRGETRCMSEWCEILKLEYGVTRQRLSNSTWTVEEAFNIPKFSKSGRRPGTKFRGPGKKK